jgi:hypothetical protein
MNFNHDLGLIDTFLSIDTTSLPPLGGTAGVFQFIGTGALILQSGTVLQRPAAPVLGMFRTNSDVSIPEFYNGTAWVDMSKQGTVTSVAVIGSTGVSTAGGPITVAGSITITLNTELQGLSALAANGVISRTSVGVYAARTIGGTVSNIVVTNGDGVSGNPTINLATVGAGGTNVGDSTHVPQLSYDTFGRVTAATSTAIAFPVTSVFGRTGVVSAVAGDYSLAQIGTVSLSAPAAGNILTYNGSNWINAAPATAGTVTSVAVTGSTGLAVSGSPITSAGTISLTLGTELQGLSGLASSGMIARTGAGTYTSRTISGTAGTVIVTNGDGVAGNPTITLATVSAGAGGTFQKFTTDTFGRVSAVSAVTTADITALVNSVYLQLAGGTMTGAINMGTNQITNLGNPVAGTDATNKNYVDAAVTGLSWKQSVRVATTVAGTLATSFANGSTVDGVALVTGDRILIKNQAAPAENGIYVVAASGAPTRATDSDAGAELVNESAFVDQGTVNSDTGWVQTVNAPITVGTTGLVYAQFGGSGTYTAGVGLTLSGNTFSLSSPVATALGGTGLSTVGGANTILGVNAGGTALEYKTNTAGAGISITNAAGSVTFANTGVLSFTQAVPAIFTQAGATAATGAVSSTIGLATQTLGTVFAGPVSGGVAQPTFRALAFSDLGIKLYAENPSSPTTPLVAGVNAVSIGSGASAPALRSVAIGNNSLWTFSILLSARRTDATGGGAGYKFEGVIKKDATAASTALVGTPAKSILGETNAAWDAAVSADTTNGSLKVQVTGEAAKTIRWVATVTISQVTN